MNKNRIIIIAVSMIIIAGLGGYFYAPGINVYGQYYWKIGRASCRERV
jgi:hypothetical protein